MSTGISQTNSSEILHDTIPKRREGLGIQKPDIFRLNRDVLWRVFSFNVVEKRDDITNLRHTSQVCSSWRDLALSSSSLWGRAVNIAVLGQARDEWAKEVIRRTGQALLHIQDDCYSVVAGIALVGAQRTAAITFLEGLFKLHWRRIKSVVLFRIRLDFSQEPAFEELLQQPAPYLKVFRVCISNPNTTFRLFANDAPSLRECELSHIAFNTQAPWLRQLRHLHGCSPFFFGFNHPRRERIMTPDQLLDALSRMPFLETLSRLDRHSLGLLDRNLSLPTNVLPRLTIIEVRSSGNVEACVTLLRHIIPAPGCRLRLEFNLNRPQGNNLAMEDIAAIYVLVSEYFENYLKTNPISNFSIEFNTRGPGTFKIEAGEWDFEFSIDLTSPVPFVESFFSNQNLRHFLSLLDDAEVLRVTHHMVPFLLKLRNDNDKAPTILPQLRRLILSTKDREELGDPGSIYLFLQWRWDIGFPIDRIHLPLWYDRREVHLDFSSLDEFTGLEVEWENGSGRYVCGSGNPEQLRFPMKEPPRY